MHIHQVNPYTKLLRESYKDGGSVKKFTFINVTNWSEAELNKLHKLIELQRQVRGTPLEDQVSLQLSLLLVAHGVDSWRLFQIGRKSMFSPEERRLQAHNRQKWRRLSG